MRSEDLIHHYQEMLLRHWSAKRDFPWNNEPEPQPPQGLDQEMARWAYNEAKRGFERKA